MSSRWAELRAEETPTLWPERIMNVTVPPNHPLLFARDFPGYQTPKF